MRRLSERILSAERVERVRERVREAINQDEAANMAVTFAVKEKNKRILALEKEMLEMIADYDKKAEEAKVGAEEPDTPADSPPKIVAASDAPSYRLAIPTAPIGGKDVRLRSPRKKAEAEVLEA